ncbi:MAG: hypothetical protein ACRET5_11955 [Steroidobacteraceae bacterium]
MSISPRPDALSATRRGVLVGVSVQISAEAHGIDRGGRSETRQCCFACHELFAADRGQIADRYASTGHDEGFARVEGAHDLAAVVSQFALG